MCSCIFFVRVERCGSACTVLGRIAVTLDDCVLARNCINIVLGVIELL